MCKFCLNEFSTLNILQKYRYQIKNVICEYMYLVVTTRYEIFDETFVNRKWIFHIFEWVFFLALVVTNKSHLKRWANLASNGISTRLNWVRIIRVWKNDIRKTTPISTYIQWFWSTNSFLSQQRIKNLA